MKFIKFDCLSQNKEIFFGLLHDENICPTFLDYTFLKSFEFDGDNNPYSLKRHINKDGSYIEILIGHMATENYYFISERNFYNEKGLLHHESLPARIIVGKDQRVDMLYFNQGSSRNIPGKPASMTIEKYFKLVHYPKANNNILSYVHHRHNNKHSYTFILNNMIVAFPDFVAIIHRAGNFTSEQLEDVTSYLTPEEFCLLEMISI